jgi:DNA-binding transcriptional ArsR family regulator
MNAMDVALICKALGDANRLEIVKMLSDGEKCGCKLLERFEITQPTLSHHMKILMECGLVNARKDGKLDVTLNKPGLARKDEAGEKILARLQKQGGFLPVGDKSSPELIYSQFSMSKGTFKKAIGGLFKQGLITIEDGGIRLV